MLLALHNLLRWAVLLLGVVALLRSLKGIGGGLDYTANAKRALSFFTMSLHLQLLLGLVLYGTGTLTRTAMGDMGAAMKDSGVRFFVAEHPVIMIAAVVIATVAGVIARRGPDDAIKHRRAAIGAGVTLLLLLAGMPWQRPFLPHF